jgi:hypothetical protein
MIPVRVTVMVGRKATPVDDIRDASVKTALKQAAKDIGTKLANAKCPTHGQGPTDVRLDFDAAGNGDLKYESCCEELGKAISKLV